MYFIVSTMLYDKINPTTTLLFITVLTVLAGLRVQKQHKIKLSWRCYMVHYTFNDLIISQMSLNPSERFWLPPKKRFKSSEGSDQSVCSSVETCDNPGVRLWKIRPGVIRHTSWPGHCVAVLVRRHRDQQ